MLHVTNGAVVVSRLHALGLPGRILPWDDVLHEGPVPAGLEGAALRRVRAEFLAINWGDVGDIEAMLAARDAVLEQAAHGDEVVLWFEHDLYDQLQVLQVLHQLRQVRSAGAGPAARVSAILADDYLGAQRDEHLAEWYAGRTELSDARWQAAEEAWRVFREPDPAGLGHFDHPGAWRALKDALHRHLQQFPSVYTGLSRTEAQTLAAVAGGPRTPREVFRAANHAAEDAVFMGDAAWWWHVRALITAARPLLAVEGTHPGPFTDPDWWREDDEAPRLRLTDDGERVLAGQLDRVSLNGLDRWLGGVHLVAAPADERTANTPHVLWRWNEAGGRLEREA